MFKKISKAKARLIFNTGGDVYFLPNKMRIDNSWMPPAVISYDTELSFDGAVNAYSYYNCNAECGRYISYYIKES